MTLDTVWAALCLVLVIEGLLPFANPAFWRRVFTQALALDDGQIRFFGLCSMALGLLGLLFLD